MTNCSICGGAFPEGGRFCPACGSPVPLARCRQCSAELPAGARFCAACGVPSADGAVSVPTAAGESDGAALAVHVYLVGQRLYVEPLVARFEAATDSGGANLLKALPNVPSH